MNSTLTYLNWDDLHKKLEGNIFAVADSALRSQLRDFKSANVYWLDNPEAQKNMDTFEKIIDFFIQSGIERSSVIYAIGGGATSDIAGFVASTILRGVSWIAVPTTLLAMIDASIGGKVGINHESGKNLIGAFHLPQEIYICPDFLSSLSTDQKRSGEGEILKYGLLCNEVQHLILMRATLEQIIFKCGEYKQGVIQRDFREQNERMNLNLGHTFGHGFEKLLNIPHGKAIAIGMVAEFCLMKDERSLKMLLNLGEKLMWTTGEFKLPRLNQLQKDQLFQYIKNDKKKNDQKIKLVKLSESEINRENYSLEIIKDFIDENFND